MLPGIRIRPAVVSDLEDLVRVGAAAFEHNPASAILFPERLRIKPGRHQDENEWRLQRYQKSFGKPNLHIYVAVEDVPGLERAEQVVGFTVWTSPPPQEQEQEQSSKQEVEGLGQNQGQGQGHPQPTEQQGEGNKTLDGLPPSLDKEALQKLQADTAEFVKSMLGGPAESKYWGMFSPMPEWRSAQRLSCHLVCQRILLADCSDSPAGHRSASWSQAKGHRQAACPSRYRRGCSRRNRRVAAGHSRG